MSAWMITNDHADFLATAYKRLVDAEVDPQAFGRELLHENMLSLQARYGDKIDQEALDAYVFAEWPGDLNPGWVHQSAACADYQCCEHEGWDASASCKRMGELAKATEGADDRTAPWGIEAHHRPAAK